MDISDHLSYEEKAIQTEVTDLGQAKEVIDFLWHPNIEREHKLNQSSNNSSVPPSKNKPQHQHQHQTKEKKSDKFQGAQLGHKESRRILHPHDEHMTVKMYKPESHVIVTEPLSVIKKTINDFRYLICQT